MTRIEPELWVEHAGAAVRFYEAAFGAEVVLLVGEGDDVVARLRVGDAWFWISAADAVAHRHSPLALGGTTGRVLLVVDDPDAVVARAVDAGARQVSAVEEEHGWRLGRIVDPYGHEWEIATQR